MQTNEAKMKELLTELENSPVVEKLRADKAKQTLAGRNAAAARIKAADDELAKTLPGLQTALDAADAALKAHDDERKALVENVRQAQAAVYNTKLKCEIERRKAESVLLETYDPAIDEAREFFQNLHEQIRHKKPDVQIRAGESYVDGWKERHHYTNAPAKNAAIEYCRNALKAIESMKLEPTFDAARLAALKREMPGTDELTESRALVRTPFH